MKPDKNPKETGYLSACCNTPVYRVDPNGVKTKHWIGFQCSECGNQSPLTIVDLKTAMGWKEK